MSFLIQGEFWNFRDVIWMLKGEGLKIQDFGEMGEFYSIFKNVLVLISGKVVC